MPGRPFRSESICLRNAGYAARDFVSTHEGLFFAVVANGIEENRVPAFLRYRHDGRRFHKLDTESAQAFLQETHSDYLYRSRLRDAELHGVPVSRIERHYVPHARVRELQRHGAHDRIERVALQFLQLLIDRGLPEECLGVTGSLLIGAQRERSDIDVVVGDREQFQAVRTAVRDLLESRVLEPLTDEFWRAAWRRRGGSLPLEDYVWHERRKFNKLSLDGVKIDVGLALRTGGSATEPTQKLRRVDVIARVVDDSRAFDYPAVWRVESDEAQRIMCWTPTYTGQAFLGETIAVQGWLEETADGTRQVVVGTSRESAGELIAVVRS